MDYPPDSSTPRNNEGRMTREELLSKGQDWSLACDNALLLRLQDFSENLIKSSHDITADCDILANDINTLQFKLSNVTNEFLMLGNTQFVENCVQEFEECNLASTNETLDFVPHTKAEKEQALIEKMKEAIQIGVKVQKERSDSRSSVLEDSLTASTSSRFSNSVNVAHLIGSSKFFSSKFCGLKNETMLNNEIFNQSNASSSTATSSLYDGATGTQSNIPFQNYENADSPQPVLEQREKYVQDDQQNDQLPPVTISTPHMYHDYSEEEDEVLSNSRAEISTVKSKLESVLQSKPSYLIDTRISQPQFFPVSNRPPSTPSPRSSSPSSLFEENFISDVGQTRISQPQFFPVSNRPPSTPSPRSSSPSSLFGVNSISNVGQTRISQPQSFPVLNQPPSTPPRSSSPSSLFGDNSISNVGQTRISQPQSFPVSNPPPSTPPVLPRSSSPSSLFGDNSISNIGQTRISQPQSFPVPNPPPSTPPVPPQSSSPSSLFGDNSISNVGQTRISQPQSFPVPNQPPTTPPRSSSPSSLFGDNSISNVRQTKTVISDDSKQSQNSKTPTSVSKPKDQKSIFESSDSDSDIFSTTKSTRSTKVKTTANKKSSVNVFNKQKSLFNDSESDHDRRQQEATIKATTTKVTAAQSSIPTEKISINPTETQQSKIPVSTSVSKPKVQKSIFESSDSDSDIFSTTKTTRSITVKTTAHKKSSVKVFNKQKSFFDDSESESDDRQQQEAKIKTTTTKVTAAQSSIPTEKSNVNPTENQQSKIPVSTSASKPKVQKSIFESSDSDSDIFSTAKSTRASTVKTATNKKSSSANVFSKEKSLFNDSESDNDDDLFSTSSKFKKKTTAVISDVSPSHDDPKKTADLAHTKNDCTSPEKMGDISNISGRTDSPSTDPDKSADLSNSDKKKDSPSHGTIGDRKSRDKLFGAVAKSLDNIFGAKGFNGPSTRPSLSTMVTDAVSFDDVAFTKNLLTCITKDRPKRKVRPPSRASKSLSHLDLSGIPSEELDPFV